MALPRIISVDDHVVEPPHVWQTWLPEKHRERGPRVERKKWGRFQILSGAKYDMVEDPDGEWGDAWYYDDELVYVQKKFVAIPQASTTLDANGDILFDRTQMTMTAITYDGMRKGCWDRDERVKDLALNHTDGSLPFPTFPRFCGQTFYEAKDKELALACVKANNAGMVRPIGWREHPSLHCSAVGCRARGGRDQAQRRKGRPGHCLQRVTVPARIAQHQHAVLGSPLGGLQRLRRDRVHARRFVLERSDRGTRLAPRRRCHPRVQQRHGVVGRLALLGKPSPVPQTEVGLLRRPDRLDPVCPRARRHGVGVAQWMAARKGEDPCAAVDPVLRPNLRLFPRRSSWCGVAVRGG